MNSIEISNIGAACGKNRYEPKDKIILLLLCRQFKSLYKQNLFEKGAFKLLDMNQKTYDTELKAIYNSLKSDINHPNDFTRIENEVTKKLKSENKQIKEEDLSHATQFLESTFKKDCGINNEKSIIKQMNYVKGNNEMYTYEENGWSIRGLHDATHGEIVIEVKTRMRAQNVKKNEYDLYQLFGYLLAMNKTKGKIVQKYNKTIYDSDIETEIEYGLVDIQSDKWKEKFNVFKNDLNNFFDDVRHYNESSNIFDITKVINQRDFPIAVFDIDGIPHNINPKYEKIVKALT